MRELVEGQEPVRRVVAPERLVPPAIAERDAGKRQARGPDRAEMREHGREDRAGLDRATRFIGLICEVVEEPARTRQVAFAEDGSRRGRLSGRGPAAARRALRGR